MLRIIPAIATILAALLFISNCGGGGGNANPSPAQGDQQFGGLWEGALVTDGGGIDDIVAISTDAGQFQFLLIDSEIQVSGNATVVASKITGSGFAYASLGNSLPGGATVSSFSFTGTLVERDMFTGDWQMTAGNTSGSLAFDYDPEHTRDSSLSLIADTWVQYDDQLNPLIAFSIDNTGAIFGQSATCTSTGQIVIPDSTFNVYEWMTTVSGPACPIAGDYVGLGAIGDTDSPNDSLIVLASNANRALLIPLQR